VCGDTQYGMFRFIDGYIFVYRYYTYICPSGHVPITLQKKKVQPPHWSLTTPLCNHVYIRVWEFVRVFSVCRFILRVRVQFILLILLHSSIHHNINFIHLVRRRRISREGCLQKHHDNGTIAGIGKQCYVHLEFSYMNYTPNGVSTKLLLLILLIQLNIYIYYKQ